MKTAIEILYPVYSEDGYIDKIEAKIITKFSDINSDYFTLTKEESSTLMLFLDDDKDQDGIYDRAMSISKRISRQTVAMTAYDVQMAVMNISKGSFNLSRKGIYEYIKSTISSNCIIDHFAIACYFAECEKKTIVISGAVFQKGVRVGEIVNNEFGGVRYVSDRNEEIFDKQFVSILDEELSRI